MPTQFNESFTDSISAEITINKEDAVIGFSLIVESGTCTILGSGKFKGQSSSPITLTEGQSYTKLAQPYSVLSGYTITPSGSTNIDILK